MASTAPQAAPALTRARAQRMTQRDVQSRCVALLTTVATVIGAYDLLLVVLAVG